GAAYLYKSGRLIWKDPEVNLGPALAHLRDLLKKKQITKEQYDQSVLEASFRTSAIQVSARLGEDDTIRSFARTWVEMMNTGPLLGLAQQHEKATPDPGHGQSPKSPTNNPAPTKPPDDSRWSTEAAAALKAGDTNRAISILRDAIDLSPMDVGRRILLIKTLMQVGQPDVAAKEARRAAELMPEKLEFR